MVIKDVAVARWLVEYRQTSGIAADSTELLCGGTYDKFRRVLRRTANALGLGATLWRSHSFRRGGATTLFTAGLPVRDIAVYGRWLTISSCRLYLAQGEQELLGLVSARAAVAQVRIVALAALAPHIFRVAARPVPAG